MSPALPGVYIATKKNQTKYYRASITHNRKHISLGSFDSMPKANLAYREADHVLHDFTLGIENYHTKQLLSFAKWVSLINFRDNGIYFCNPIYTRKKYFLYYLTQHNPLIFDIDDLFYYSSHKIMQRKGHLFVADYGMQYNILNRYRIKNYSVLGRDYRFINDNPHDFRYENIEIYNIYHGITQIMKNETRLYKVKIHVRSYYQVGTYTSEIEAAIAYNKAIDILAKNGIHKKYTPNFVEGLSNQDYATIYSTLKVSARLYTLTPDTIRLTQT